MLPADNHIPFRLRVNEKLREGHLVDGALTDLHRLEAGDLHLPLVLFQRALWQRNVEVRFLESFWIIDLLVSRFRTDDDSERHARITMYEALERFVVGTCPEHHDRLRRLKGVLVQPSLRHRLSCYLSELGISADNESVAKMVKLRNDLSHGVDVDSQSLAMVEHETRLLVREVLRKELEARSVLFENAPSPGERDSPPHKS
jgi:hypothetical protein